MLLEETKDQFEVVRKILTSPRVSSIVCATDAGREGELIFRYIYEAAGCALGRSAASGLPSSPGETSGESVGVILFQATPE